jgi:ribosomal protein S1
VAFGAFVELAPGVEGLVHISQLSAERVHSAGQVVKVDELITVKVLDIDPQRRRISLSRRAAMQEQESQVVRADDPGLKKLKQKFGSGPPLKGGIG